VSTLDEVAPGAASRQYRERVFATERRRLILEHVRTRGTAELRELASLTEASEVTVRRDLRALEERGLLVRRRGGAAVPAGVARGVVGLDADEPDELTPERGAVADLAAALVGPGQVVAVGAGVLTHLLASRLLAIPDLTVVTNSLLVGEVLGQGGGVSVVMTGGSLHGATYGLVGSGAEQSFAELKVRFAFLSGDGLTAARGLSCADVGEAGVDRAIAGAATEVVVLLDHDVVGVDAPFPTVAPERIAHLVTGASADPATVARLGELGVRVHVAPPHPATGGEP
jgi:DeoR/GlpR family transcriptional regulator of sugar metabolism